MSYNEFVIFVIYGLILDCCWFNIGFVIVLDCWFDILYKTGDNTETGQSRPKFPSLSAEKNAIAQGILAIRAFFH